MKYKSVRARISFPGYDWLNSVGRFACAKRLNFDENYECSHLMVQFSQGGVFCWLIFALRALLVTDRDAVCC